MTFKVQTADGPMIVHGLGAEVGEPPVIVLMPAPGVTEGLMEVAGRLAFEGFRALVPELYHRIGVIGPRVEVPAGAGPQAALLGRFGRRP